MFARCPACRTVFRVRSEQLRAHLGQVRCGSCLAAFNALDNLLEELEPPPAATPPAPALRDEGAEPFFVLEEKREPTFSDQLDFELPDALLPARKRAEEEPEPRNESEGKEAPPSVISAPERVDAGEQPPAAAPPESAPDSRPVEPAAPAEAWLPDETLAPVAQPAVWRRGDRTPIEPGETRSSDAEPLVEPASPVSSSEDAPPLTPPAPPETIPGPPLLQDDYVTDSPEDDNAYAPSARSGMRRGILGLAVGILAGVLAIQSIYLFRSDIAREWPKLRPALVRACSLLKCEVELPRIAGAISVEASDLQSEPGKAGRFVLNATIRNRADHPQAYPHLELTLTDKQDRPLLRRVLAPPEWAPGADIERGFAAGRDITLSLPFAASGLGATGYRIYAFYP